MNRTNKRNILLLVGSIVAFVVTVSLISAGIAARRSRNQVRFGIEELDLLIEDENFAEAGAMVLWLAERTVTVSDALRVYKRAHRIYDATAQTDPIAAVSSLFMNEFPGNSTLRELAVYSAVLHGEEANALSWVRGVASSQASVRPDYHALALLAADQAPEEDRSDDQPLEGRLLLAGLDGMSAAQDYDTAYALTGDWRYAVDAVLQYLVSENYDRAGELVAKASLSRRAPLLAYDFYLSRGDFARAGDVLSQNRSQTVASRLRRADLALYTARESEAGRIYSALMAEDQRMPLVLLNAAFLSRSEQERSELLLEAVERYPENWSVREQAVRFLSGVDPDRARMILDREPRQTETTRGRLLELRIEENPGERGYAARVWKLIEDPTSEEALRYAVWYFRSHGSQADAELVLETARRNVGDKPWLLQYAGLIAAESGNWEAAKAAFTESFHVSPTWSSAYNASIAHFFTGWPQRGASLLEDALFLAEHSNDERRSVAYLARVRTTDDREVAMQSLREALEIDPGSPEALLLLRSLEPGRD